MILFKRLIQLALWTTVYVATWLKSRERDGFDCWSQYITEDVDLGGKSVDDFCHAEFQRTNEYPLPYHLFIVINVLVVYLSNFNIYSLSAWHRVGGDKFKTVHLTFQLLSGTLFAYLPHGLYFPQGFVSDFACDLPLTQPRFKIKSASCECDLDKYTAQDKLMVSLAVSMANGILALITLSELLRVLWRGNFQSPACVSWTWSGRTDENKNCWRNKIKGKDIKWIKKSLKHQNILEKLVKTIRYKPYAVRKIEAYYVCFEERFRIGKGSNGTEVFVGLATDGLEVAVKRLDLQFSKLAENEKNILNSQRLVDNPHVLTYRFQDESEHYAYLVTDLHEKSLKTYVISNECSLSELQNNGPTILQQILLGIDSLHGEGILHRDLKPENILVNFEAKMVLADFGLSRRLLPGKTTHESIVRGTEGWMAAESFPNDDDDNLLSYAQIRVRYKEKSDIQVLGMLFYFVLTKGTHPFGRWYYDRLTNITRDAYDLTKLKDPVPKDLIEWMLQHDITKRPTAKQCLKHPYLIPPEESFGLLKAVGNKREIKTKDHNSIVVRELNKEVSLTTSPWSRRIDAEVYKYFSGSHKYSDDVADLLRFIRNAAVHWNDKPQPSSIQHKVGTPQAYFLQVFPTLPMIVHRIIRKYPNWCNKDDLKTFF